MSVTSKGLPGAVFLISKTTWPVSLEQRRKLGWARKCRTAYERAIELEPRDSALRWSLFGFYLVAPRIAGGGTDRARVQADAIGALDPASGRIARAPIALAEQRCEAASAEFEQSLRESPRDFILLYQVGRLRR